MNTIFAILLGIIVPILAYLAGYVPFDTDDPHVNKKKLSVYTIIALAAAGYHLQQMETSLFLPLLAALIVLAALAAILGSIFSPD